MRYSQNGRLNHQSSTASRRPSGAPIKNRPLASPTHPTTTHSARKVSPAVPMTSARLITMPTWMSTNSRNSSETSRSEERRVGKEHEDRPRQNHQKRNT